MISSSGTIVKGVGGFYTVDDGQREFTLRAQAKFRRARLTPLVGDRVRFESDGKEGWVTQILPRKNALLRPPVANLDALVLVLSASAPAPDLLLTDRQLLFARAQNLPVRLVVNKADENPAYARELVAAYCGAGVSPMAVSAKTGAGVDALKESLRGLDHAFSGQSGAGKSTLINALYGFSLETGALSDRVERGKHTTRHCEMIRANEGHVFDTPGFSLLELPLADPLRLKEGYPEFAPYEGACRFAECAHLREPGCALRAAVEAGEVDAGRYERYQILFEEMKTRWKERYD